jgi:hypothetical protein
LRKSIKLSRVEPAGNQKIPGPFRSALDEDRGLHFHEPSGVQEMAQELHHLMVKDEVFSHSFPAQIKITIPESQTFLYFLFLIDVEGRRKGKIKDGGTQNHDFNLPGRDFRVFCSGGAKGDFALYAHHILIPHFFSHVATLRR